MKIIIDRDRSKFRVLDGEGNDVTKYFPATRIQMDLKAGKLPMVTMELFFEQLDLDVIRENVNVITHREWNQPEEKEA